ncbi:unnamed protein product [Angiostrongylus costaricensis]|uniref:guanylate cyclase n=1 Tax=Angiostrongylus costaricensis TaxID=334426 RepID=A0A158PK51_ANGCS|nr:unnamed protein product [Angiostrongylus costaricensis]
MLLCTTALIRSIASGLLNPSGEELVRFAKGTFEGFTGEVTINGHFTRDPVFLVYGLDADDQQIVLMRNNENMENMSTSFECLSAVIRREVPGHHSRRKHRTNRYRCRGSRIISKMSTTVSIFPSFIDKIIRFDIVCELIEIQFSSMVREESVVAKVHTARPAPTKDDCAKLTKNVIDKGAMQICKWIGFLNILSYVIFVRLKRGGRSPIRPELNTVDDQNSRMLALVKDCWSEEPDERPSCDQIQARMRELTEEKKKADILLYRMLPKQVAEKLKLGQSVEPEVFECATLFFSDVVSFTTLASSAHLCRQVETLIRIRTRQQKTAYHY